jgi:lactoylglutathione lyase
MTKYLHTMIRVSSLEDSIAFFEVLGLREIRRRPDEKGRYTNVFLAAPGDEAAALELTYNWDSEPYTGGRNFGHLAYAVENIYDTCNAFIARGVTINRPPRDGRMAFIRTPDGISIELLQAGGALPPAEPWTSMANTGSWSSGELLARPVMDFRDVRCQSLVANQPSRAAARFRSHSVPAWDWGSAPPRRPPRPCPRLPKARSRRPTRGSRRKARR